MADARALQTIGVGLGMLALAVTLAAGYATWAAAV
jgi:hypothetical protein